MNTAAVHSPPHADAADQLQKLRAATEDDVVAVMEAGWPQDEDELLLFFHKMIDRLTSD